MDRVAPASPTRWPMVAVLVAGAFVTALNVTLLSPLLKGIAADFDVSDSATGQLATLTAACSGLTALLAAPWMDRWSRRAWLRFECALLAVGTLLSALAPTFGLLLAARAIAGVGGAIIFANCLAATADLFPDTAQRNRVIGLLNTAATLGAVVGLPALTQIADAAGWRWAVAVVLVPAAIVLAGTGKLPGTVPTARGSLWQGWWTGYRRVLRSGETTWLLGLLIVLFVVWFGWLIYFGAFAETAFGAGAGALSALFLVGGGGEIVAGNVTPMLLRRRSPRAIARVAVIVLTVDLLLVGIVWTGAWGLAPFIVVASAASTALFVCVSILLLDSLPAARGAVMSLQSAVLELGGSLGAAGFGVALALSDDYEASYRLLGLLAPLALVCLALSGRHVRVVAEAAATP